MAKSGARTHAHSKGTAREIDARCWVVSRKLWECNAHTRRFCDQTARLAISVDLQTSSCCGSFQSAIVNPPAFAEGYGGQAIRNRHCNARAIDVGPHRLRNGAERTAAGCGDGSAGTAFGHRRRGLGVRRGRLLIAWRICSRTGSIRATSCSSRSQTKPRAKCSGRAANLLPVDASGIFGRDVRRRGNRILRGHGNALGYSSGFTIMDREDQKDLINAVAARFTNYFHKEDRNTKRHLSCKLSGRESCSAKEKAAAKNKRKSKLPKKRCS